MRRTLVLLGLLLAPLMGGEPVAERRVVLQSPLTTLVRLDQPVTAPTRALRAVITVPTDAPTDLGVGVFVVDQHGRWFQGLRPGALAAGTHAVELPIAGANSLLAMSDRGLWTPATATSITAAGLFFWSAQASRATILVREATLESLTATDDSDHRLTSLRADGSATTGQRWSVSLRPQPFPSNPFDPAEFSIDAVITLPDGKEQRVPGFLDQPMANHDRGDRETVVPTGADAFTVRFRPRQPGAHTIRLEARWGGENGTLITLPLPSVNVSGKAWDGYVRVDQSDPRFFALDGALFWPRGPNLRSIYDTRGSDHMRTILTPDRGLHAYET
ncbi:MAG TPA: hypothetical protein VHX44_19420, partial [Planctomycetota bacterium]|nr:hypothetical protein [Planctomycetota bacterium]